MNTILYTADWTKQKQISLILKKIMKNLLAANLGSVNAGREVRRENRVLKDLKEKKAIRAIRAIRAIQDPGDYKENRDLRVIRVI